MSLATVRKPHPTRPRLRHRALLVAAVLLPALLAGSGPASAATATRAATAAATVQNPVPRAVVNRFRLDTGWYAKYVEGPKDVNTGASVAVLGSAQVADSTLLKAARQLEALVRTWPYYPVGELDRRNLRVVITARNERMSSVPEVRAAFGTSLDDRYWAAGIQCYFDVDYEGRPGGDGVHNDINTRAELTRYGAPLFRLLDRVHRGAALPS